MRSKPAATCPRASAASAGARLQYVTLLKRLLRQWAIPPARQFNRLPSRARVVTCAGLHGVWQYSRGVHAGVQQRPTGLPPMANCQVINHTPAGYALRQTDAAPTALRIGELVALRIEGKNSLQVAMVRWFRNTLKGSGLEFGCELLSDSPEAAAAAAEGGAPRIAAAGGRAARGRRGRRRRIAAADHRARRRVPAGAGGRAQAHAAARASRC